MGIQTLLKDETDGAEASSYLDEMYHTQYRIRCEQENLKALQYEFAQKYKKKYEVTPAEVTRFLKAIDNTGGQDDKTD